MILPVSFFAALVARFAGRWLLEPALPQQARSLVSYLFLVTLASLFMLLSGEGAAIRRSVRPGRRDPRLFRLAYALQPLIFYLLLMWLLRWDAYVRFRIAPGVAAVRELLVFAPYFWFEFISLLGVLRFEGELGVAGERVRATWLFTPLILLFLAWNDLWLLHPLTRAAVLEFEPAFLLCDLLGATVVIMVFPVWFLCLFRARPIQQSALRQALEDLARRAGVKIRGVHKLITGGRSLNAGVLGIFGWTRRVFFTDLMLACFAPKQIEAVFAHEIAHVKRRHSLRQVALLLVLALLVAQGVAPQVMDLSEEAAIAVFVGVLILLLPAFRFMNHRFEHEADLFGSRYVGSVDDMIEALEEVERRIPGGSSSIRHPSTERRIRFLRDADRDPVMLAAWFRRTYLVQSMLFLLLGIAIGCYSWRGIEGATRDYPGFLLTMGYPEAAQRRQLALGAPESEEPRRRWERELDQMARAVLLLHGENRGPSSVAVLRERAMRRALRSLRRGRRSSDVVQFGHYRSAFGWMGLVRRWGMDSEVIDAMYLFLDSYLKADSRGVDRARALLEGLRVPTGLRGAVPL
ncbi:MAG: M48 family metalloprotease [Planctomycetota bacterium]